jgi:hypothetical protein
MAFIRHICQRLAALGVLLGSLVTLLAAANFPEFSALRPQASLPDPLTMLDGRTVKTAEQWIAERRPELKALFQHYMYGAIPPTQGSVRAKLVGQHGDFLGGTATLKLLTLQTGTSSNAPQIDLMLVVPKERRGRAPVFLAMNFCGNHALTDDKRVPLARGWMGKGCQGCTDNRPTEAARGTQATNWPLAELVRSGYALATFHSADIDPDRADLSDGIYAWLAAGDLAKNNPTNRGTIAAWAWGFHRCVDYLVTQDDIDAKRIAAVGHSRNGKTALLAAAFDERIAMAFPHQAGCGGSAPSRGKTGESVQAINDRFPHWFNAQFKQFNSEPERLPFDQHCLVALCAPRPVLFSAAEGDQWANPSGQFEVLRAADKVYRLLGAEGLGASQMPGFDKLISSRLGYYIREGKHSMTAADWRVFIQFANHHWAKAQPNSNSR